MPEEQNPTEVFDAQKLSQFDGKNGHKCYVAIDGIVYEISGSHLWVEGEHITSHGLAFCGNDLTEIIKQSPHGKSKLSTPYVKKVGIFQKTPLEEAALPQKKSFPLGKYQIAVWSWGILVCIGFIISNLPVGLPVIFTSWVIIVILGNFIQFKTIFEKRRNIILIHLTWFSITVFGTMFTFLEVLGLFPSFLTVSTSWLAFSGLGMVITGFLVKSRRYYYLATLYFVSAIVFQFIVFQYVFVATGIVFFIIQSLDAFGEDIKAKLNM